MNLLRALPSDDSLSTTPKLFSAADLIMGNLKARREERVIATLRLASTLLKRHCGYTVNTLIRTCSHPKSQVTIGHHEKELDLFLGLISPSGLKEQGSQSYESYIKDAMINLEIHPCSDHLLHSLISPQKPTKAPTIGYHAIRNDDPLLRDLLRLFSNFFTNCVELNLWLTRVVVDLCSCRFRSAEGWLLFRSEDGFLMDDNDTFITTLVPEHHSNPLLSEFDSLKTELDTSEDDSDTEFFVPRAGKSRQKPTFTKFPPLFTMLKTLHAQIQHYKSEFQDHDEFNLLLEERRRALGFLDGISSAMNTAHHTPSNPPTKNPTPTKPHSRQTSKSPKRLSTDSVAMSVTSSTPFSLHFERTRKLIQPLFPMGMENSVPSSPEESLADLRDREGEGDQGIRRRTGEFEPPEEISLGRLLNNIIVFEVLKSRDEGWLIVGICQGDYCFDTGEEDFV